MNLFIWDYVVGGLGSFSAVSVFVLYILAYDGAYSELKNTNTAIATKATELRTALKDDMTYFMVLELSAAFILNVWKDDWLSAQWDLLADELKQAIKDE